MKTTVLGYCLSLIIGYLIGSIPNAIIIAKLFYHIDIREHGSKNAGGTNVLRVCSVPAGIIVMLLDAFKAFIAMYLVSKINIHYVPYIGIAACIGHCFPIFANFKGGKAVACSCGYVLAINLFIEHKTLYCFVIPMIVFALVLVTTKYMSLSSISAFIAAVITGLLFYKNITNKVFIAQLAIFVIYMHRANIKRLINGNENKLGSKK